MKKFRIVLASVAAVFMLLASAPSRADRLCAEMYVDTVRVTSCNNLP